MFDWLKSRVGFVVGVIAGATLGSGGVIAGAFAAFADMSASVPSDVGCLGRTLTVEERRRTARHEIGHAVVLLALEPDWFERTDVYASGVMLDDDSCASGVTTASFPASLTRLQLIESIAMEYGGYAVDVAFDGGSNSGVSRDITIATTRAIVGVDSYGMGRRVRPYDWSILASQGFAGDSDRLRSEDVRELLDIGLTVATLIVDENREQIDGLTQALVDAPTDGLDRDGILAALTPDTRIVLPESVLPSE